MNQSRRNSLQNLQPATTTNAGLWLDKYIKGQLARNENVPSDEQTPQAQLVADVSKIEMSEAYEEFYKRWKNALKTAGATTENAKAQGRIAIDLGAESVLETSVCLHHTYGLPYIPGSALKGLAAHYAHNQLDEKWDEGSDAYKVLFGTTESAGYITFYDALYIPGSGHGGKALWPDIITVHHPEYYRGDNKPPADWDSPTPIPFLSATGNYLIALSGPEEWVKTAFEILALALKELGIGAKTSSGYGRMLMGEMATQAEKEKETYAVAKLRLLQQEAPPPGRERNIVKIVPKGTYGFANSLTGGKDIYIDPENLQGEIQDLKEGQVIEYQRVDTDKGPQAKDVDILLNPD